MTNSPFLFLIWAMLAINHVTLATAITFGASLYFERPFFLPFISFVVFAALLPDIDHPGSEISRTFPFVNKLLPHRGVSHSIVGSAVFAGILYFLLGQSTILSLVLIIAALIGVRYLHKLLDKRVGQLRNFSNGFFSNKQVKMMISLMTGILNIFLIILVFLIWKEQFRLEILTLLVVGYVAHIVGDFVTKDGVPIFWPFFGKIGLKLFRTGSNVEVFIGFCLLVANSYLIYLFWQKFNLSSQDYWLYYLNLPVKVSP